MIPVAQMHVGEKSAEVFIRDFLGKEASPGGIFLVSGPHSYVASGAAAFLSPLLAGYSVTMFSEFSPNPQMEELRQALALFRKSGASRIIAIGGGSAMDIGKLVNYFAATHMEPEAYVRGERGAATKVFPLLAVPTTAGSGSEATHFAVLYDGLKKTSVADGKMTPSHVWLNAVFTESLSPYQTACSGFDALAQAIESYWAAASTVESIQDSASAIRLCLEHLEGAVLEPTLVHRTGMLKAANLAGKAINVAKTTAAHALSYAITAQYGLAHGHAVALTLPAVFEANDAVTDADTNDLRGVGHVRTVMKDLCLLLDANSAILAADRLRNIMYRIGLSSAWFEDHGINPMEARALVLKEVNQERLGNNPRRFTPETLKQVVASIQ